MKQTMALYVQNLNRQERQQIEAMVGQHEDDLPANRLRIILMSAEGKSVPEISKAVNLHPINVRKWIHRFSRDGVDGLRSARSPGRPVTFTSEQRVRIINIANADPRQLGLHFSRWSLQRLRRYLIEQNIVQHISVETIRQILQTARINTHLLM
jgi:transposase